MIIYIDDKNGSNSTGNGSSQSPYKTLQYFCETVATKTGVNYEIMLADGVYQVNQNAFGNFMNCNMIITGNQKNTIIKQMSGFFTGVGGGNKSFNLTMRKLVYDIPLELTAPNLNMYNWYWNFENVVFLNAPSNDFSVMLPHSASITTIKNCFKTKNSKSFFRTTNGSVRVTDSIGGFTSGYGTNNVSWNISGNILGEFPYNNEYVVTGYEKQGVFSGAYAWISYQIKSLFLNNGQYMTYIAGTPEITGGAGIPPMTSNTSPSGTATSSPLHSAGYEPYLAMNGKRYPNGAYWYAQGGTGWLAYEFPTPVKVSGYEIAGVATVPKRTPKNWTFEIYDEITSTWTVLDTNSLSVADTNAHRFNLTNPIIGKRFRINVTSSFSALLAIDLFQIYTETIPATEGRWESVSTTYPTKDQFLNSGISDLEKLDVRALDSLSNNFKICFWTDKNTVDNPLSLEISGRKSISELLYAIGDISLLGVEAIDSITLSSSGDVKVAISFDGGLTYKSYSNGSWNIVTDATYGMTQTEINSLTAQQISEGRLSSDIIRFSYSIQNDATIDSIKMIVSMQGKEKLADTKDYTLSYDQGQKKLIYNITKSGTYSVNYVDGSA